MSKIRGVHEDFSGNGKEAADYLTSEDMSAAEALDSSNLNEDDFVYMLTVVAKSSTAAKLRAKIHVRTDYPGAITVIPTTMISNTEDVDDSGPTESHMYNISVRL